MGDGFARSHRHGAKAQGAQTFAHTRQGGAQGRYCLQARHAGALFGPINALKKGGLDGRQKNLCTICKAVVKDQFAIRVNP